jgi:predicted transcriptional regulator
MLPNLNEIKSRRKQLGLTQSELAQMANVSQSLIAKIEAGQLIPTYEKAKRLFDALTQEYEKSEVRAKDFMVPTIYSVNPGDSVKRAVRLMESKAVSQLPVLDKGRAVGKISEKTVLNQLSSGNPIDLGKLKVEKVMEESMPIVQEETPLQLVSELLKHNQAVLIARKGKVKGIIAKSDLLKSILKKR